LEEYEKMFTLLRVVRLLALNSELTIARLKLKDILPINILVDLIEFLYLYLINY